MNIIKWLFGERDFPRHIARKENMNLDVDLLISIFDRMNKTFFEKAGYDMESNVVTVEMPDKILLPQHAQKHMEEGYFYDWIVNVKNAKGLKFRLTGSQYGYGRRPTKKVEIFINDCIVWDQHLRWNKLVSDEVARHVCDEYSKIKKLYIEFMETEEDIRRKSRKEHEDKQKDNFNSVLR